MNAGRMNAAYDVIPPHRTDTTARPCDGAGGGIYLRCGPAARVGTSAAPVRAPRTRAGRDVGRSPALRAARAAGHAPAVRTRAVPVAAAGRRLRDACDA